MLHPSDLNPNVVAKIVARRGHLHAYDSIDPIRTALVVIDLNTASVDQNGSCLAMLPRVNAVASTLRAVGGRVAWVTARFIVSEASRAIFGTDADRFSRELAPGSGAAALHPELHVDASDLRVEKAGASAFFPGKCELGPQLRALDIDTVLIAGTVTNVCCESSAHDAAEDGFRVVVISDACAGHGHGLHEASLTTFYRCFDDVRPASEIIGLIRGGVAPE